MQEQTQEDHQAFLDAEKLVKRYEFNAKCDLASELMSAAERWKQRYPNHIPVYADFEAVDTEDGLSLVFKCSVKITRKGR